MATVQAPSPFRKLEMETGSLTYIRVSSIIHQTSDFTSPTDGCINVLVLNLIDNVIDPFRERECKKSVEEIDTNYIILGNCAICLISYQSSLLDSQRSYTTMIVYLYVLSKLFFNATWKCCFHSLVQYACVSMGKRLLFQWDSTIKIQLHVSVVI